MTAGLETFAKVRALHDSTTNPGEKAAAAGRMKKLARNAGLTVAQAKSKLDAPTPMSPAQATANAFNDFFNTPEMRAQRTAQDRAREVRRGEILARYGTVQAVYAETEREAALRVACKPMTIPDRRPDFAENYTLDGWDWCGGREKVPLQVRAAVSGGWPLPKTLTEAWAEFIAAEEHERDRQTMHDYEHFPALWSEVRRYIVEDLLDTLPAASIADMLVRQSWLEHLNDQGFSRDVNRDAILLATMRADIERIGARLKEEVAPVQNGHDPHLDGGLKSQPISSVQSGQCRRTNADKRRDVLALLNAGNPGTAPLTDREIARRAGVSPQTVGNVRRSLAAQSQHEGYPDV